MASEFFDVCVCIKRAHKEQRFRRCEQGYADFLAWLEGLGIKTCWFGVEHTGGYEQDLARYLIDRGHRVSMLDGLRVLRFKESLGKKSKTDKIDARAIERFIRQMRPAFWVPLPDRFRELLDLNNHRDALVKSITQWKNRKSAPKSNAFARAQECTIIDVLQLELEAVEEEIRKCVQSDSEIARSVKRIISMKGIKLTTAAAFVAESGPITRRTYPTPESLTLTAGMAPIPSMSGKNSRGTYTKPYGNQRMRDCLNMSAVNARRFDPAMATFAARLEKKGKSKRVQIRAVKRKLIHIIWALVINDEDYDPNKAIKM